MRDTKAVVIMIIIAADIYCALTMGFGLWADDSTKHAVCMNLVLTAAA